VTEFKDPQPQPRGVTHHFVTYQRKTDGVELNATSSAAGLRRKRLPVIMWAYPRELATLIQPARSPVGNRFTTISGYSHLFR
jgi:hypothetical protein